MSPHEPDLLTENCPVVLKQWFDAMRVFVRQDADQNTFPFSKLTSDSLDELIKNKIAGKEHASQNRDAVVAITWSGSDASAEGYSDLSTSAAQVYMEKELYDKSQMIVVFHKASEALLNICQNYGLPRRDFSQLSRAIRKIYVDRDLNLLQK